MHFIDLYESLMLCSRSNRYWNASTILFQFLAQGTYLVKCSISVNIFASVFALRLRLQLLNISGSTTPTSDRVPPSARSMDLEVHCLKRILRRELTRQQKRFGVRYWCIAPSKLLCFSPPSTLLTMIRREMGASGTISSSIHDRYLIFTTAASG